jgi:hypothetical protein
MASSILLKYPRNSEVMETKKGEVRDALERLRKPLQKTEVKLTVNGVFGLPEPWKAKLVSEPAFLSLSKLKFKL